MEPAPEKLLQAARTEFLRNGYKKTSVADIAAAAGLAVGSVYKYYPSKKELFFDIYFAENAAVKDQAARTTDWDQPREAMMHVIHHFAAATQENKILQAWDDPKMGPELHTESLTRCQESEFHIGGMSVSGKDLIMLTGGLFLLYKATTELHERIEGHNQFAIADTHKKHSPFWGVVLQIIVLDAVFRLMP